MELTIKLWIFSGVLVLFPLLSLGGIRTPLAMAQTTTNTQSDNTQSDTYLLKPFNLAEAAYRGALEDEGIPGYGSLRAEYNEGITNARDIVRAGVRAGFLPAAAINDQRYINDLDAELQGILGPS